VAPALPADGGLPTDRLLLLRAETLGDAALTVAAARWLLQRHLPRDDLPLSAMATSVVAGAGTDIVLATSQRGVLYQLSQADGSILGDALAGTGDLLALPTGPLRADARLRVQASRADDATGRVLLAADVLVQVAAKPADPPA
jgi:hypothetical protein